MYMLLAICIYMAYRPTSLPFQKNLRDHCFAAKEKTKTNLQERIHLWCGRTWRQRHSDLTEDPPVWCEVDGSNHTAWWFRNPKEPPVEVASWNPFILHGLYPPFGCIKNTVKNEVFSIPTGDRPISSINSRRIPPVDVFMLGTFSREKTHPKDLFKNE